MTRARVLRAVIVQPFSLYGNDNSYHADSATASRGRFIAVCGLSTGAAAPRLLHFSIPGLHLKLSSGQIVDELSYDDLRTVFDAFGASRIMWGSNFPVTDLGGYATGLERALEGLSLLDAADREQVFGHSAIRFWSRSNIPGENPCQDPS